MWKLDVAEESALGKGAPKKAVKKKREFSWWSSGSDFTLLMVVHGFKPGWGGKILLRDSAVRNKHTKAGRDEKTWLISLNS